MNHGLVKLALAIMLSLGVAFAQTQDAFLERYVLVIENLNGSVSSLAEASVQSLENLDRAAARLGTLAEETTSDSLISGMESTFERAREAILNRSETDLAVQVAALKGGFQRLVYEAALRAASAGDAALAQARLTQIASDMGLSETAIASLTRPLSRNQLQLVFESGVAQTIRDRLATAGSQAATDQFAAYRTLALAYGAFIPIQDSPRIDETAVESFVTAINALVANDNEGFAAQLQVIDEQMLKLTQIDTAAVVEPKTVAETATVAPSLPSPAPESPASGVAQTPTDVTAADEQVSATSPESPEAVTSPPPTPLEPLAEAAATSVDPAPTTIIDPRSEALADLEASLAPYRLSPAVLSNLSNDYLDNGFNGTNEVVDELFATSARALSALELNDQANARKLIDDLGDTYQRFLAPIVSQQDAAVHSTTTRLLDSLKNNLALRSSDIVALMGHIDSISTILQGGSPAALHRASITTNLYWAGLPRLTLMILLALLAFLPLRLLNLAFGGGNRNWQWIGASLFLLLLPIIYEGLSFLGSLTAELSNIDAFNALASFSMFQNSITQVVWVLITAIAIIFASVGLYGICVQFGLLGRRTSQPTTAAASAATGNTTTDLDPSTAVDWDEEF